MLALSDTDSGDDPVFVTPRKPPPSRLGGPWGSRPPASSSQKDRVPWKKGPNSSLSLEERGFKENRAPGSVRSWQREMRETSGSESSDEEIASLAVHVKQAMVFSPRKSALRPSSPFEERGPRPSPRSLLPAAKKEPSQPPGPDPSTSAQAPKNKALADVTQLHRTQTPRGSSCQIPVCFLEELSDPDSQPSRLFRSQKEKLAQDLYAFYNTSVFQEKVVWSEQFVSVIGPSSNGPMDGQMASWPVFLGDPCEAPRKGELPFLEGPPHLAPEKPSGLVLMGRKQGRGCHLPPLARLREP
ncbi:uncharacterized protein LOC121918343, partial [Sceloporus undulatus]|uniref:uncharacterized protein LOC121918343 n=1 Tax=Sceloporus undulatus TaxID=8520 RepID=UPI001C4D8688